MRFGSLFSGIGGFDLGLERAGMVPAWQVEIDPRAREVLRRHWPDVPHHEDVTQVGGGDLGAVDLACGGFPCQDLSVAGRRAGLAGERSGLFHEFMRVVDEVAPRWVLIENVPGLLSSNGGRDMGTVLGVLGQLGYGYAWRILDSQYFGVPQRRRRVFIVGCAGGVCLPEVLFEPESLPGDSPPCREAGEEAARDITGGVGGEGVTARSLTAERGQRNNGTEQNIIAHTLKAEGHDASEDGTGRGVPLVAPSVVSNGDAHSGFRDERGIVAFSVNQRREGRLREVHGSVTAPSGTQVEGVLAFDALNHTEGDIQHTLRGGVSGAAWGGVTVAAVPRRLTPRECERLQGFPDDWTRHDSEGREIADSPRYRMLGNAVTVSVAEWIARRIMNAEATK